MFRQLRHLSNSAVLSLSKSAVLKNTSTSTSEIAHFNALALSWWDIDGSQRILHKMNLLRMDFIHNTIRNNLILNEGVDPEEAVYIPAYNIDLLPKPISSKILQDQDFRRHEILSGQNLTVLDVGCGGGILSESMARLPFVENVKGIDLSPEVLEVAKIHKSQDPTLREKLNYELIAVEELDPKNQYDIVTMFEILEHVNYPSNVMTEALKRVKVGGWIFISTINRDFVSWFTTIFMGEHLLRIVPVGTHTLSKYIDEAEIRNWMKGKEEFKVVDSKGCIYLPAYGWKFTENANVGNYFMAIQRTK